MKPPGVGEIWILGLTVSKIQPDESNALRSYFPKILVLNFNGFIDNRNPATLDCDTNIFGNHFGFFYDLLKKEILQGYPEFKKNDSVRPFYDQS